jgi:hypothetical protein
MVSKGILKERLERRARLKRTAAMREYRQRILIVCEGEKTEPNYFRQFELPNTDVVVVGTGKNTVSVVEDAVAEKSKKGANFESVWCVFDRDSFPSERYENAFILAAKHSIEIAWSNEAFELWYLLHFDFHDAALSRHQYAEKLTEKLGEKYDKTDPNLFAKLLTRRETAIQNAEKLISSFPIDRRAHTNPGTTVHRLVKLLQKK